MEATCEICGSTLSDARIQNLPEEDLVCEDCAATLAPALEAGASP